MDELWCGKEYVNLTTILDTLRQEGYYSNKSKESDSITSIGNYVDLIQLISKEICKKREKIKTPQMSA